MKSYKARMLGMQKAVLEQVYQDIVADFGPALADHGFTQAGVVKLDRAGNTSWMSFKDPIRGDSIDLVYQYEEHRFGAQYFARKADYADDEIEPISQGALRKQFAVWLGNIGIICEECGGDEEYYASEADYEAGVTSTCPVCQGKGIIRPAAKKAA